MCTCIDFKTKAHYFGRNLDLEYRFNEKVVITPRNYSFPLKNAPTFVTKYAMIGMASVKASYPLYAEASNEKGLAMAGLYFPGNAQFFPPEDKKLNLAPYELIPYFLGLYENIAQIKDHLHDLVITSISFDEDLPVSALHWMISDGRECLVLEQTKQGLQIFENPLGVLTNNPSFAFHQMNLNNYLNLSTQYAENRFSEKIGLKAYGQGMGALGLPGDASPASRFVRAAFHKFNACCQDDELSSVSQFFHILDSVAMLRGSVITEEGLMDSTTYSCCINIDEGIYYYKTYNNNQITALHMTEETKNKGELSLYELVETQQIRYENHPQR